LKGQQAIKLGGGNGLRLPLFIGQKEASLIAPLVKLAVADKVEDVPGAIARSHRLLQIAPALAGQPGQLHPALVNQRADRRFHLLPLPFNIKPG
jgi:hypothetical protein